MRSVGQWHAQADNNDSAEVTVDGKTLEVRYSYWEGSAKESVSQEFGAAPTGEEFYDWFHNRAVEVIALTGLGFEVYDSDRGSVFWERDA